ncbi:sigma 54-interacting transcriptional regulator [Thalassotalea aquiviva]|uniref:sigma 54-interacting transcriptional regulator n=1 Tax=Thalassotalea aquiviva TaxID=3242415 RepID=UPI00352A4E5C
MRLEITCKDRVGIANEVFAILVEQDINIKGIDATPESGQIFVHIPDLEFAHLQQFMPKLRMVDGVIDVKTTMFMPSERHRNVLDTIVRTLPDPMFSIDTRANVYGASDIALQRIGAQEADVIGQPISHFIKGFHFHRYMEGDDILAQTRKIKFQEEDYVADILPITVDSDKDEDEKVYTGALIILKSEARLGQQVHAFRHPKDNDFAGIVQHSPLMRKVVREARKISLLNSAILIHGEVGTGKELLARSCHNASERAEMPFMTINCASLPDATVDEELYGKILTTKEYKKGVLELAEGGTLFLDEVSYMTPLLQSRLLRSLEDGFFRREGEEKPRKFNIRFISASSQDLNELVNEDKFRQDLLHLINTFELKIPALRERMKDIVPLAEHFVYKAVELNHRENVIIEQACLEFIETYPWPGNVRQLENVMLRAVSLLEGEVLTIESLNLPVYSPEQGYLEGQFVGTLEQAVKGFEADLLRKLYPAFPSTRQLAKKLGLSHTAIANKLREYNINKKTVKI